MGTFRLIVTLGVSLVVMSCVVALRAEATRLRHEAWQVEQHQRRIERHLRQRQLQLAELRNPTLLREHLARRRSGAPAEGAP